MEGIGHDYKEGDDGNVDAKSSHIPPPLKALHHYCLWCCSGSALEVRLCPAKSCPLWGFRFGRKPTAEMLADMGDRKMYPLEDELKVVEFYVAGGTALKTMRRRCLDCSGNCKSEVKNCWALDCDLYPFRFARNPNREMSPEQRKIAAARLKNNIKPKKDTS